MKKLLILSLLSLLSFSEISAQIEYKVITSIESIVPNGIGRSRIISANEDKDYKEFTSTQTENDKTRNKFRRLKVLFSTDNV